MSSLRLAGLRRVLGGKPVLDGLSLTLASGEFAALVGPSGSGKTTLLRLVAGLDRPDAGVIEMDGTDATPLPPERRGVAVVFQQPLLFPHMTVAENVGFGLKMRGIRAPERVAAALEQVQMGEYGRRYPAQLSGGQQQRVALARALVTAPRLLLLDEPFSHLDPGLRAEMRALVQRLQRESGISALLVTHDHEEALQLADQLGVLLDGRLAQAGRPLEVLRRPATRAVAAFMQSGALIGGVVTGGRFDGPLGVLPAGGLADGPAWLVLPPGAVQIRPPGEGAPAEVIRSYATLHGPMVELRAGGATFAAPGEATGRVGVVCDLQSVWYVRE
ncbi:MAG TPA: ABC transporter ATP-binding protein [Symbiobacteriaceae bacterium]|nr:ABC transporter ATP-binding protein [Symbiobacteriaceae bacterium]